MTDDSALARLLSRLKNAFGGGTPDAPETPEPARASQAAALVWRKTKKGKVEMLLVTSRGTGRWILPKGWVEEGESSAETAQREAWEEAGIEGSVSAEAIGNYDYDKIDETQTTPCRVVVHTLAMERQAKEWPEREERERRWASVTKATELVDEPELKLLLETFGAEWIKRAA